YARLGVPQREPPAQGDYLVAHLRWIDGDGMAMLQLPFDRYYLEEHAAPAAEQAYRDANRAGGQSEAYVSVRVRDGRAVLEELFINNVPVRRLLAAPVPAAVQP
ncbi:MAG: GDYXXLXY domain-containing protein, partial [Solimonas sp.]